MPFDPEKLRQSAARLLEISQRARTLTQSTVLDFQRTVDLNSPAMSLFRDADRRAMLLGDLLPKIENITAALNSPITRHALKVTRDFEAMPLVNVDVSKLAIAPTVIESAITALDRWPTLQLNFHSFADRYADIALKLGAISTLDERVVHTSVFLGRDIRVKSGLASLLYEPTDPVEPIEIESDPGAVLAAMRARLTARDSSYAQLFDEADDALRGKQRGRARMIFLALREISKELLNDLAPAKSVRAFTTDPDDFMSDGRPRHKAQLAYICRSLPAVGLEGYLSSGRRLTRRLFAETNKIVHARSYQVGEQHIQLLLADADELVAWLLEMAELGETKH